MADQKKFLDAEGVKYLWSKINMQDYPNNETLMGVIEAIDETKADRSELFSGSWNDLTNKPFIGKTIVVDGSQVDSTSIPIAGYRKVSDYVPSKEELLGGSIKYAHNSTATTITEDNLKTNNYYISGTDCLEGSYFLVVPKDTGNYKKGIYYRSTASYNHILTFTSNKTLDTNKVRVEWEGIDNKPEQYPTNWDLVENKPEEFISSWEKVNNKPLNHISKATISEPESQPGVGHAGIYLDDFYHLSGVMPTLEDFSEGYDVITFWPVEIIHYDSSTVLTGDYFDSGFYNVYDSNGQFIIFYEDGNLSDGRDVKKGTYLNTNLITSLIVKPQTVLDPVQIKVDWDGVINKPNFALKEEFHKIAQSGSWNDLTDKPFIETIVTIEDTVTSGETAFADSGVGYLENKRTKFHDDAYFIVRLLESGNETKIDASELWTDSGTITVGDLALQFERKVIRKTGLRGYTITGYTGELYISYNYPNGLKLDETYIPETIARLDDIPNAAGKKVEGTVYTVGTSSGSLSFTAGTGAEVFNVPAHGGTSNKAIGDYSHAEGYNTSAYGDYQHTQGKFNIDDTENKYAHIVGNGTNTNRSNAHTIDWEGNAWYQGDVYVGSTSGTNKDEGSKKLATEEYVNNMIENAKPAETTPEDIIEWMDQEGAITLLASTSGQVYATNDNKILII